MLLCFENPHCNHIYVCLHTHIASHVPLFPLYHHFYTSCLTFTRADVSYMMTNGTSSCYHQDGYILFQKMLLEAMIPYLVGGKLGLGNLRQRSWWVDQPVRFWAFPGKSVHCIFIVDFHFDYESHCPGPHECGETGFNWDHVLACSPLSHGSLSWMSDTYASEAR